MLIWILCFVAVNRAANIDCSNATCTACDHYYLYKRILCLPLCPNYYTQTTSPSVCTQTAAINTNTPLFQLKFYSFLTLTASSINNFQHPAGLPFSDSGQGSPIPTKERGFYFQYTSQLVSTTNYILAPDFSLVFALKVTSPGSILTIISGSSTQLSIQATGGSITATIELNTLSSTITPSISIPANSGWNRYLLYTSQVNEAFSFYFGTTGYTDSTYEFRDQRSTWTTYLGGATIGSSFSGFFYEIIAYNVKYTEYYSEILWVNCEVSEYLGADGGCYPCDPDCTSAWPWCVNTGYCSACFSPSCQTCTGYSYSNCTACIDNAFTAPDCILGNNCAVGTGIFSCSYCIGSYVLIDTLCLNLPYSYDASNLLDPVISTTFDTFTGTYSIFTSGASSATYAPFNTPEADDPYPVRNRGLYFTTSSFLLSNIFVALNYQFTISFWALALTEGIVVDGIGYYAINSNYSSTVLLSNTNDSFNLTSGEYYNYAFWKFISCVVSFSNGQTTVTDYWFGGSPSQRTADGYAFYDSPSHPILIGGPTSLFTGFLYSITIWNTATSNFLDLLNICGSGLSYTCLLQCGLAYYYNDYVQRCLLCDASCTDGCAQWGTCNKCLDPRCASCTSYESSCDITAGMICDAGLVVNDVQKCCNSLCGECYGVLPFQCTACAAGEYLLGTLCVDICPLGFGSEGSKCVAAVDPFISLEMWQIENSVVDSASSIIFITGTGSDLYPYTPGTNNPIPAAQRGYYFNSNSFMASQAFYLSYNFTVVLFVKPGGPGVLLSKSTIQLSIAADNLNFFINSMRITSTAFTLNNAWACMAFCLYTDIAGVQRSGIFVYPSNIAQGFPNSLANFIYEEDSPTPLYIGDYSGLDSFTGFIWQLKIYSSIFTVALSSINFCTSPSQTLCVNNCNLSEYFDGEKCLTCDNSCVDLGCIRGSDCSLCSSVECGQCSDFNTCVFCINNAGMVDNVCACDIGFYFNKITGECNSCFPKCRVCTGPAIGECICPNNSTMENEICTCNSEFVMIDYECLP